VWDVDYYDTTGLSITLSRHGYADDGWNDLYTAWANRRRLDAARGRVAEAFTELALAV
jgi:hypothetical protein